MAWLVWPLARASNQRPTRIRVTITAAASKYTLAVPAGSHCGEKVATVEKAKAAVAPSTTSEFMSGVSLTRLGTPFR